MAGDFSGTRLKMVYDSQPRKKNWKVCHSGVMSKPW